MMASQNKIIKKINNLWSSDYHARPKITDIKVHPSVIKKIEKLRKQNDRNEIGSRIDEAKLLPVKDATVFCSRIQSTCEELAISQQINASSFATNMSKNVDVHVV